MWDSSVAVLGTCGWAPDGCSHGASQKRRLGFSAMGVSEPWRGMLASSSAVAFSHAGFRTVWGSLELHNRAAGGKRSASVDRISRPLASGWLPRKTGRHTLPTGCSVACSDLLLCFQDNRGSCHAKRALGGGVLGEQRPAAVGRHKAGGHAGQLRGGGWEGGQAA